MLSRTPTSGFSDPRGKGGSLAVYQDLLLTSWARDSVHLNHIISVVWYTTGDPGNEGLEIIPTLNTDFEYLPITGKL